MKKAALVFFVFVSVSLFAAEYREGRVRLVINEKTGRFSLYYMTDIGSEEFVPFFSDQDPRTSFLALTVNDRTYKMGESAAFRTKLGLSRINPSLIFESASLTIVQTFTFIKTSSSSLANGVRISITITNNTENKIQAGARLLIDTSLGEETPVHFSTDKRQIDAEAQITGLSNDNYWVSANNRLAVMGSIAGSDLSRPDFLHFANWKRLTDASWKLVYSQGRNFNFLPYSIGDSAVCYYFEPAWINNGESRTLTFFLASKDGNGFAGSKDAGRGVLSRLIEESSRRNDLSRDSMQEDLIALRDIITILDEYMASSDPVSEDELAAIELILSRQKTRYGLP